MAPLGALEVGGGPGAPPNVFGGPVREVCFAEGRRFGGVGEILEGGFGDDDFGGLGGLGGDQLRYDLGGVGRGTTHTAPRWGHLGVNPDSV